MIDRIYNLFFIMDCEKYYQLLNRFSYEKVDLGMGISYRYLNPGIRSKQKTVSGIGKKKICEQSKQTTFFIVFVIREWFYTGRIEILICKDLVIPTTNKAGNIFE